ncbi:MAG: hypothetical protein GX591_15380 [Planctomycetes bacterium]|nr:hypothetical protein [Planctomycetota bacterium]
MSDHEKRPKRRSSALIWVLGCAALAATVGLGVYSLHVAWPYRYGSHTRLVFDVQPSPSGTTRNVSEVVQNVRERLAHRPADAIVSALDDGRVELLVGHDDAGREKILAQLTGNRDTARTDLERLLPRLSQIDLASADEDGESGEFEQPTEELEELHQRMEKMQEELLPLMLRLNLRSLEDILWLLESEGELHFYFAARPESAKFGTWSAGGAEELSISPERVHLLVRALAENGPTPQGPWRWHEISGDERGKALSEVGLVSTYRGRSYILLQSGQEEASGVQAAHRPWKVRAASCLIDEIRPTTLCLSFELDEADASRMRDLTNPDRYRDEGLAIVVDGICYAVPRIRARIAASGIISNLSLAEATRLAAMFNCTPGSLGLKLPAAESEHRQEELPVWQPWPKLALAEVVTCGLSGLVLLLLGKSKQKRKKLSQAQN